MSSCHLRNPQLTVIQLPVDCPVPELSRLLGSQLYVGPKKNGGRHCCQPPLRRAKDLPVFVTWKIKPCVQPTRSRVWLTSSGVASDRTTPSLRRSPMAYLTAPPEGSLVFRPSGLSLENPHSGTE